MIVLKPVRIDLARPARTVVHCMQTDNTQRVDVSLFVNNRPYDVTADVSSGDDLTMAVAYILPNGYGDHYTETALGETAVEQDSTIAHLYHVMIDGACTDVVGFAQIIVKFTTDGGQILNSFPLTLDVIKSQPDDVDPDGGSPATSRYLRKDLQTPATEEMTQPVGVTPGGLLVTAPGGGGGSGIVNPVGMGFAYSTSSTAQATSPKTTGTVSGFALKQYAIVVVRFSYAVNSGQTLNFSETGAKDIYFRNSAIGPGVIEAGDTVTFQYDGTRYRIISIDKAPVSQTDDSNYFIHLTPSPGGGGAMLTDRTASDIYTALAANTDLNFILIDGSGRQAHFTKKPTSANDSAEFTLVANGNQITYTLPTNGGNTVTITTESIIGGGGGTLQHSYGFMSQAAYEAFVEDYPDAIQPGDFIYITDRAQNNVSVKIYQRNDLGTLNQIITTIGDNYIVTLTESSGTWSASHDGNPVTFDNIVNYGVNEGKRIVAYIPSLGLYIPADYIFTTGSDQYLQFDAVTFNGTVRMGQSFVINSSGVQADIKALGKVIVHATTQDGGASYLVDYYASQIITMRQYDANIVLVDSLTGDEYPLIGDNGSTAAYFGGFNRGMTKTVLFTVFNATNVPSKSEVAYPPSGGGGGSGAELFEVTISVSGGVYSASETVADIMTAYQSGKLVKYINESGAEGLLFATPTAYGITFVCFDDADGGHPTMMTIYSIAADGTVTVSSENILNSLIQPGAQTRTNSQMASGLLAISNVVYTITGDATGFVLTNSSNPITTAGECVEIRLATGSTAITTPTWPAWCNLMNGWDGNFSANTYYDLIIDDAGNVFAGTREVSA